MVSNKLISEQTPRKTNKGQEPIILISTYFLVYLQNTPVFESKETLTLKTQYTIHMQIKKFYGGLIKSLTVMVKCKGTRYIL